MVPWIATLRAVRRERIMAWSKHMTHDDVVTLLFLVALGSIIVSWILFVMLGQITVRKLRRNPATKDLLGIEFLSGLDIVNVSFALARLRSQDDRLENGPLAPLYANARVLRSHTTRLDRVLARTHFWSLWIALAWLGVCAAVHKLG